jgi:hypothetical protein
MEMGNMVFMQYKTFHDGTIEELPITVIDTGIGMERFPWLLNGTSDPDVPQPAPDNYYPSKLRTLIENFRSEPWYGFNKPFICGETIRADGVNTHLRALNNDSDPYTACVAGAGLPSRSPGGAHFNASALRTIGKRYANEYYSLTN